MKKILVPTDFSQCAEKALSYAVKLAKKADAEIILVHACDLLRSRLSKYTSLVKEYNNSITEDLFGKLKKSAASVEETGTVKISEKLYEGDDITDCILMAANDFNADLIVMGTQGAATLKKKVFGSNAADVINKSAVPVMTIPYNYAWAEPKNILIVVDDTQEGTETLMPVFEIARLFNGKVRVAIFTEEVAEVSDVLAGTRSINLIQFRLKKMYKESEIEIVQLSGTDFHETVQQFISGAQIDILAMITHKRNFWQNIFNSSMTQKMSYHSSVPLLSIHSIYQ